MYTCYQVLIQPINQACDSKELIVYPSSKLGLVECRQVKKSRANVRRREDYISVVCLVHVVSVEKGKKKKKGQQRNASWGRPSLHLDLPMHYRRRNGYSDPRVLCVLLHCVL